MGDMYSWQQKIWQRLTQNSQFWGHALLLKGRKGIGKYDFARQLAKSVLCTAPTEERKACAKCLSCGWFEQNGHPNFCQIMPEALSVSPHENNGKEGSEEKSGSAAPKKSVSQQIGVEQIRKLTDFVYMTGHQDGHKIVLIYPAEAMNSAAANALLKKLEEPPENVLFILVTHQAQHLLPTIRSRCQQVIMPVPDVETSVAWLRQCAVNDPQASLAAAGYSPLSAWLFDNGEDVAQREQFLRQIGDLHRLNPLSLAEALQQTNLAEVVNWLQKWCYDLVSYRITGKIRYYLNQLPEIQALSSQMDVLECIRFTRDLNSMQRLSHHPLNPRLFLEELFIAYTAMMNRK
jgi:DNA polymerase-3 subunit delta'